MRPTDCTPEVTEKVCEVLSKGGYRVIAAKYAGIDYATLKRWLARGAKGEEPFCAFCAAVKKAEVDAEHALTEMVFEAGKISWQAAMALNERRHPERWARRDRVDPNAPANLPQFESAKAALAYMDRVRPTLEAQAEAEEAKAAE